MPGVDEIEVVARMQPRTLEIVDHEFHIRRHPGGLDWREVDAEDGGRGVLVAHCASSASDARRIIGILTLDCPDARACAHI
jgi:hypothetical protein